MAPCATEVEDSSDLSCDGWLLHMTVSIFHALRERRFEHLRFTFRDRDDFAFRFFWCLFTPFRFLRELFLLSSRLDTHRLLRWRIFFGRLFLPAKIGIPSPCTYLPYSPAFTAQTGRATAPSLRATIMACRMSVLSSITPTVVRNFRISFRLDPFGSAIFCRARTMSLTWTRTGSSGRRCSLCSVSSPPRLLLVVLTLRFCIRGEQAGANLFAADVGTFGFLHF